MDNQPLSRHAAGDSLLQRLPLALLRAHTLADVLTLTAQHVMQALEYEDCVVYVVDADGTLVQRAAWGPKSPGGTHIINPLRLALGEGIVGAAAQTRQSVLVIDTHDDDRYISDVAQARSELAVPIVIGEELLGVIDSEHSDPSFYTERDAQVIESIAAIAGIKMRSVLSTEALQTTIDQLDRTRAQLESATETDPLTEIGNRRYLTRHLDAAAASVTEFGICAFDLDGFKSVNDFHGHHEGDRILRQVARVLDNAFGATNAVVARTGGDEFVAFAHFVPAYFTALCVDVVEKINVSLAGEVGDGRQISTSAGIAFGASHQTWRDADDALFVAKKAGGNQVRVFDPDDDDLIAVQAGRTWSERIQTAMQGDEMRLVAQPIVALADADGSPLMYETLLRYREPTGTWLEPRELLAAAARFGLELELDQWVLQQVLSVLKRTDASVTLAINWSRASIQSPVMTEHLITQVQQSGVEPARLVVEITEHVAIDAPEIFASAVRNIRANQIRVAIDDLGSGWTTLRMLQQNLVDFVKLDGNWVAGIRHDQVSRVAIKSMIDCAHLLGTQVIAEWIEDEETRQLLIELGASFGQGWLFGHPEPLAKLTAEHAIQR